jgi:6-phosphofructokinase
MRIGLLTGGGDAPGLNGILESVSRCLLKQGCELVGIQDGFEGIFEGRHLTLTKNNILGIHSQAGTLLGTSNKTGTKGREVEFLRKYKQLNLDGLVVAGGDGTFSGLSAFSKDIPIIGVPKTIDNDLAGTEITFGFDTACSVVADSVDALRATADAHKRILIVETMGRTAGWIALGGGLASMSDVILIPERPYEKKALVAYILKKKKEGLRGLMITASEGATAEGEKPSVAFHVKNSPQSERYGGFAERFARFIENETSWEARHVVLGHLQRSKAPSTTDRFLTISMGVLVAQLVSEKAWGKTVVYRNGRVISDDLKVLMAPARLVDPEHRWVKLAQNLDLFI